MEISKESPETITKSILNLNEEKLLSQSPIRYTKNVKTPTPLIISENDLRCTIQQAEEFFVALKELGVDRAG